MSDYTCRSITVSVLAFVAYVAYAFGMNIEVVMFWVISGLLTMIYLGGARK